MKIHGKTHLIKLFFVIRLAPFIKKMDLTFLKQCLLRLQYFQIVSITGVLFGYFLILWLYWMAENAHFLALINSG